MGSHATGWSSDAPTPAQLKELFAQVENGRITKRRLQEFLRGSTGQVSLEQARDVVGKKNFFGPEEWKKFFGKKFQLTNIPDVLVPWSHAELENPGINQEHFLFLSLDSLGGEALNLPLWHKVFPGRDHPRFYLDWYLRDDFAQKSCSHRWYLMPVGIVEGSHDLSYDKQVSMLPNEYEVPSAVERVSANVLYYLLNNRYLDVEYWARTDDKSVSGGRILVRASPVDGVSVYYWAMGPTRLSGLPPLGNSTFQGF